MFCYQCEQTAKGQGCSMVGVCGKQPDVAALQDLLIYSLKGLARVAHEVRRAGVSDSEVNRFAAEALFATVTNVDFDPERFPPLIRKTVELRERLKFKLNEKGVSTEFPEAAVHFNPAASTADLVKQGERHGIESEKHPDPDIHSIQQLTLYGLKGMAAYADHAAILGQEDTVVYDFIFEALSAMLNPSLTLDQWVALAMKTGEVNLRAMELLDKANTGVYGHPVPTKVPLGHKKGKAILVSGHDLKDMEEILKQTQGKGIFVYTHGEMLPLHGYPGLKKYPHFYGHYGTAWQNQTREFDEFPGAIIMTTNCIQKPRESYKDNIFTTGLVGWPGVRHISGQNFSPAIERALELPGFESDQERKNVMVGFAHNAVMSVAGKVIALVKAGKIRHFFLVGGCDGAKPGRSYYTEFVEKAPENTVILTLACGKFRFFDKNLGHIDGIPRLLDIGQCNDAYSAIQIAVALANAFGVGVNDLPLSLVLSWYEQKAVVILLTLLYLGIKNIRLGPSLPAFVTPNVLDFLVKTFDIKPISTPDQDLAAILK